MFSDKREIYVPTVNFKVIEMSQIKINLKRGPLSDELRRSLTCRGSGIQVRDCLARHGYDVAKGEGAAVAVASIEPGTGRVQGLRWFTVGRVLEGSVKLKYLFPSIQQGGWVMEVSVEGEKLVWPRDGPGPRNVSDWLVVGRDCKRVIRKEDGSVVSEDEAKEAGVKDVLVRVMLHIGGVEAGQVTGHMVPVTLEELREKLVKWGNMDQRMANIPTVATRFTRDRKVSRQPVRDTERCSMG